MTTHPRWSGAQLAPKTSRGPCRHHCGVTVDSFRDTTGLVVQLDTQPPPIDRDLTGMQPRVFEYRGPRIGWVSKWNPSIRTWREMRIVHECVTSKNDTDMRKGM